MFASACVLRTCAVQRSYYGLALELCGEYSTAEQWHRRATYALSTSLGPTHPETAFACQRLGIALLRFAQSNASALGRVEQGRVAAPREKYHDDTSLRADALENGSREARGKVFRTPVFPSFL